MLFWETDLDLIGNWRNRFLGQVENLFRRRKCPESSSHRTLHTPDHQVKEHHQLYTSAHQVSKQILPIIVNHAMQLPNQLKCSSIIVICRELREFLWIDRATRIVVVSIVLCEIEKKMKKWLQLSYTLYSVNLFGNMYGSKMSSF